MVGHGVAWWCLVPAGSAWWLLVVAGGAWLWLVAVCCRLPLSATELPLSAVVHRCLRLCTGPSPSGGCCGWWWLVAGGNGWCLVVAHGGPASGR